MYKKFSKNQKVRQKIRQVIHNYRHIFLSKKIPPKQLNYKSRNNPATNNLLLFQKLFSNSTCLLKKTCVLSAYASSQVSQNSPVKKTKQKEATQKNKNTVPLLLSNKTSSPTIDITNITKNSSSSNMICPNYYASSSSSYLSNYTTNSDMAPVKISEHALCLAIAPVHLRGLDAIGKVFGKSRITVRSWRNEGAPIAYDGVSYCSEYNTLFAWYLNHYRKHDNNITP